MGKRIWINTAVENLINQGMGTMESLVELKRITSHRIKMVSDGYTNPRVVDKLIDDLHFIEELIEVYAEDLN